MLKRDIITLLFIVLNSSFLFAQGGIKIDTKFESGSIGSYRITDSVTIPGRDDDTIRIVNLDIFSRFDPKNPVDTSLSSSARWYYFRLTGVKNCVIYLNIFNSEAIRPFFSYDNKNFERFSFQENSKKGRLVKFFDKDTVYICHYIPYTYSRLNSKIEQWSDRKCIEVGIIGKSHDTLDIPMLKITDGNVSDRNKKVIWIHGRSHPSESPASWHLEGLINQISDNSEYAKEIRKKCIFYIVPFINPDGVYGGYSRSSSTGVNLEINWDRPDSLTMPEVKVLKRTIDSLYKVHKSIPLFLNMHSQIANSVTYWIHDAASTTGEFFKQQMLLSNLTAAGTPYYRPEDQSFSKVASRYAEGWIWDRVKEKTLAITFETPYTYYREDINGAWVSPENLGELATSSLNAITDYLQLKLSERRIVDAPKPLNKNSWQSISSPEYVHFGEDHIVSLKVGERVTFKAKDLKKGRYSIYLWRAGRADNFSDRSSNIWESYGEIDQKRDGTLKVVIESERAGEVIDAILLKKIGD